MGIVLAKDQEYETYFKESIYGKFDPKKIITNLKTDFTLNKPEYSWWGSPVDAHYGWKEYAELNISDNKYNFKESPIRWKLWSDSKIFQIGFEEVGMRDNDIKDSEIFKYIYYKDYDNDEIYKATDPLQRPNSHSTGPALNFEEMCKDGIVAVELMNAGIGHYFSNAFEISFNGWDCESIVVLNKKKIIWLL